VYLLGISQHPPLDKTQNQLHQPVANECRRCRLVEFESIDEAYLCVTGPMRLIRKYRWSSGGQGQGLGGYHRPHLTTLISFGQNPLDSKLTSGAPRPDVLAPVPVERVGDFLNPIRGEKT